MPKNLYIGDLHIGHENILYLDNRPFRTMQEMTDVLVRNWRQAAGTGDTVFVLGDMFWPKMPQEERSRILDALPGRKILIRGNHDEPPFDGWDEVCDSLQIQDGGKKVVLSHYPMPNFDGAYKGSVHLYAHVHDSFSAHVVEKARSVLEGLYLKPWHMYNVGCMVPWMNYAPRTLDEIQKGYAKCAMNRIYGYRPEISSMLTLSSGHISGETAEKLEREGELNAMGLSVYPKANSDGESFGWYVYIPGDYTGPCIPGDLKRCLAKAHSLGCGILCLDSDGPEDPSLDTYDW